jgi:hypothetical protein
MQLNDIIEFCRNNVGRSVVIQWKEQADADWPTFKILSFCEQGYKMRLRGQYGLRGEKHDGTECDAYVDEIEHIRLRGSIIEDEKGDGADAYRKSLFSDSGFDQMNFTHENTQMLYQISLLVSDWCDEDTTTLNGVRRVLAELYSTKAQYLELLEAMERK